MKNMLNLHHEGVKFMPPNRTRGLHAVLVGRWGGTLIHCGLSLHTGQSGEIDDDHSACIPDLAILFEEVLTKSQTHAK